MAEDNPFLSFFESMGTGMEAGAERRSLMQRAQRGQLEPGEEVPGLGRTILKGITRAATPANTRLAQDQLKLQAANYALQRKTAEDRQAAIDAQNYYKNTLEAKEAELEAKNSMIYTQAVAKDRQLAQSGKWNDFDATIAPEGMGAALTDKYYAQKKLTGEEFDRQNFLELSDNKALLVDSGSYTPESVTQMSPDAVKAAAQTVSGRYGKLDDMLLYIPVDQRASVKTQVLTGTPDQKREAWAMLDRASIEVASSIGKIQQDIKRLKAEGGADNLAFAQQLQSYADNLGKGEEAPSYTITTDENGKTTIQVGPASVLEDKDLKLSIVNEIPQSLAMVNRLEGLITSGNVGIPGGLKAFFGRWGSLLGEAASYFTGAKIQAPIFEDVESVRRLRAGLVQNVRKSLRADVGPISNFEQKGLDKITEGLAGVTSAAQLKSVLKGIKELLTTSRYIKAHAIGEVPLLIRGYDNTEQDFRRAVGDLIRLKESGEVPPVDLKRYMDILVSQNPDLAEKLLPKG